MYDYTCPACGRREPDIELTRDHIVAVSDGGTSFVENLQPLCEYCNQQKGNQYAYYPPKISMENRAQYA
jgi:5-methylcytosine-specific restriction endonuclease McrA